MPSSIKCFKRFFKYTWHPQQMESPCERFETRKTVGVSFNANDTELGEVKIIPAAAAAAAATTPIEAASAGSVVACGNGGCKTSMNHQRNHQPRRHETPWHSLKTIFLVSVIVALIVWVIVYTLLSQYKIL